MAIYRNIQMTFWTDTKITDDFTPEDRYFYLYLFTNPHTNLAGCYEISIRQASNETGYNKDTIERLLDRFENVHNVINFSKDTKEVLLINWHKYNWTKSVDFRKALKKEIDNVKNGKFRAFLMDLYEGVKTVSTPSIDGVGTTDTVTDTDIYINKSINISNKHKYGEYKNVLLTDDELQKLKDEYSDYQDRIERLSSYVASTGKAYKSHYATIRNWARRDKEKSKETPQKGSDDLLDLIDANALKGDTW